MHTGTLTFYKSAYPPVSQPQLQTMYKLYKDSNNNTYYCKEGFIPDKSKPFIKSYNDFSATRYMTKRTITVLYKLSDENIAEKSFVYNGAVGCF
jgi:hypothetical protein